MGQIVDRLGLVNLKLGEENCGCVDLKKRKLLLKVGEESKAPLPKKEGGETTIEAVEERILGKEEDRS